MKNRLSAIILAILLVFTISFNTVAEVNHTEKTKLQNSAISRNINYSTANSPCGFLDSVTKTRISGWAYQSDVSDEALTVHIVDCAYLHN